MASREIKVIQSAAFARTYKKLYNQQKIKVDDAVQEIVNDPEIGTQKRGDLSGVYVYKFKVQTQEMLLAYEYDPQTRYLLLLGSHENFYRGLKR
ncbi:type II toxin-antitoxin system RelE/ParE family toxin [Orrella daihaiensis]|uniref:Type II toxin-antitoxin system RelE/ParE family toxin n=1 Tax=Orrella daihaiensis TaxID=2782176 RepID=A0ABY4AML4_9BURK|nr:type II toxin-antitoxin system RelE/ParE family toxin [Orrella daihaiensis]UOD50320.1 type II toxin-antitoxin system RelE/ParE family toxin [Orrella daihaiensis]